MRLDEFDYQLPDRLIALYPPENRTDSRLMVVDRRSGDRVDAQFPQLLGYLKPGDLLVFNDTRVIPARLYGHKSSGGKVEILIERLLNDRRALAYIKASRSPRVDSEIVLVNDVRLRVVGRERDQFLLQFPDDCDPQQLLEGIGHIPLPPYIERSDEVLDHDRYQTVYAEQDGAVAAPTAGLHFDQAMMTTLKERGIFVEFLTLHVGAGTFQPVRAEIITDHQIHTERLEVSESLCNKVAEVKRDGGRVIAVGTTSVRGLETAAASGQLKPYSGESQLFIYPGYRYKVIDGMVTNFHLPKSSLLMLVSAFVGTEAMRRCYQHAIEQEYRFFSYGDAMLLLDVK